MKRDELMNLIERAKQTESQSVLNILQRWESQPSGGYANTYHNHHQAESISTHSKLVSEEEYQKVRNLMSNL